MNKTKIDLRNLPDNAKDKFIANSLNEFNDEFIKRNKQVQTGQQKPMPIMYAYKTKQGITEQRIGSIVDLLELNLNSIQTLADNMPKHKALIASTLRTFAADIEGEGENK